MMGKPVSPLPGERSEAMVVGAAAGLNTEHHEARGRSVMSEVATLIAPVTDRHAGSRRGTGVATARVPVTS